MRFLTNMPIKRKVTLVILLISTIALLLASGCLFAFQLVTFKQGFTRDLSALGEVMASHSVAPLTFKDTQAANEILSLIKAKPHITHAQLRLNDGGLFAQYGDATNWNPAKTSGRGVSSDGDYLIYSKPILFEKGQIGVLWLRSDYKKELRELVQLYAGILSGVVTLSILLTTMLTSRLQRVISEPILSLAETAKKVAGAKDYSVRARKLQEDEIGQLTDAFNQMLEEIHSSDTALRLSRQKFETLVNSIEGVVWEADPETLQFLFVSNQAARLFGHPVEQWGASVNFWRDHLHPEDRERAMRTLRQTIADKQSCAQEYRMLGPDGVVFWVRSYSAVVVEEGRAPLLRGVLLNVTNEKVVAEELARAQAKLVEASRYAGMAEVATGVLHNVGNVLNSVNVSTTVAREQLRKSHAPTLCKVAALLAEHEQDVAGFLTNHPKGKMVPGFIQQLARQWLSESEEALKELDSLAKNVEHIKEIVAMQQSYARVSGVLEPLPVVQMVEDALQINFEAFQRHEIALVRQFGPVPPVLVDRHKVLQILINVLRNAKYAMEESKAPEKRLTVSIATNGNSHVKVSVQDNGVGIPAENLTRIFGHGFTTKKQGHGFGLHSGALAAKEMGGSLYAQSEGPGRGATFILELPIAQLKNGA
jgi:PAS domain S-box-containing protein